MLSIEDIHTPFLPKKPCGITIGNFDGVHLGHQKILSMLRERVGKQGTVCVITFSNHPSHILLNHNPPPLLCSNTLKLRLLEEYNVDVVYCIPFTQELAALSYETFLQIILRSCPFDFLVLGQDAAFGNKAEGTSEKIHLLEKKLGFSSTYIEKAQVGKMVVSSKLIRKCIQDGNLPLATQLLGHPFMLEGISRKGQLTISPNLCLPPDGTYSVKIYPSKKGTLVIRNQILTLQPATKDEHVFVIFN